MRARPPWPWERPRRQVGFAFFSLKRSRPVYAWECRAL